MCTKNSQHQFTVCRHRNNHFDIKPRWVQWTQKRQRNSQKCWELKCPDCDGKLHNYLQNFASVSATFINLDDTYDIRKIITGHILTRCNSCSTIIPQRATVSGPNNEMCPFCVKRIKALLHRQVHLHVFFFFLQF